MKAIAVDCAVSKITLSAKNDDKMSSLVLDIGMKQSEALIPAIDFVLSKVDLTPSELNYSAITVGPGSFTGLRLGLSAVKALELAYKTPIYGISSLKAYGYAFENFDSPVISVIDARKEKFYANISQNGNIILEDGDYPLEDLISKLSEYSSVIVAGPDSEVFVEAAKNNLPETKLIFSKVQPLAVESLYKIAEECIEQNIPGMQPYDGPLYLRESEAEIKAKEKSE